MTRWIQTLAICRRPRPASGRSIQTAVGCCKMARYLRGLSSPRSFFLLFSSWHAFFWSAWMRIQN